MVFQRERRKVKYVLDVQGKLSQLMTDKNYIRHPIPLARSTRLLTKGFQTVGTPAQIWLTVKILPSVNFQP